MVLKNVIITRLGIVLNYVIITRLDIICTHDIGLWPINLTDKIALF